MLAPLTVAVPCAALPITASEAGVPPLSSRLMLLAVLLYATDALDADAIGAPPPTLPLYGNDTLKPGLSELSVAVMVKLYAPAVVGVPDSAPLPDSTRPAGKAPLPTT